MAKESRDDVEVVLVSHSGYLHYFSDDWEGAATTQGTGFTNCEARSYQLISPIINDLDNDPDARLVDTTSSHQARYSSHPMSGLLEQEKLFVEAMEGWEAQGLEKPDRLEDPAFIPAPSLPRRAETAKTETEKLRGPEKEKDLGIRRELNGEMEIDEKRKGRGKGRGS